MKIAVFGGLGAVASEFIVQALQAGHQITWLLQEHDKLDHPELETDPQYRQVLEIIRGPTSDINQYQQTVKGTSAVLVAFDPSKTNPNHWVYRQKMIQLAMQRESIKRIILITSHGSGDSKRHLDWHTWMQINLGQIKYMTGLNTTNICWSILAQYTAQEQVVRKGEIPVDIINNADSIGDLEWTILRPGDLLLDGFATGTYLASNEHVYGGYISLSDVADCALKALENEMDVHRCFSIAYSARVA